MLSHFYLNPFNGFPLQMGVKPTPLGLVYKELDDLMPTCFFILIFYSSLLAHELKVIKIMSDRARILTQADWLQKGSSFKINL